ncbi:hypothetical protein KGD82_08640 [Nocardiopsis eucommiae]|uniref:Orc1-like AAA ATPase domain-containing protein n=1 Tax=Nocardiopsis eucommiae TaxID=2831970 RepID=A0A975LBK6_9ACTN|nr:hypothetical protein KGD82_08640 [Nocardiopsis eucommiae]
MLVHEPSPAFVGRHHHLSLLAADARRTVPEGARTVLVLGGAGVGKSRLLTEHLRRVPGTPSAVGGCLELGAEGVPFAPFTASCVNSCAPEAPPPTPPATSAVSSPNSRVSPGRWSRAVPVCSRRSSPSWRSAPHRPDSPW